MSFSRDNEAFLRSQGWSGTRWDKPRDSSFTEKDQFIYDSLLKAAGGDNQLSTEEYETIYNNRGPWGKYAYNTDSVAKALAQLGSQTGIKLDQETMDRHDLTYSGDDILQRVEGGDRGPDAFKKDDFKVSWERGIEDGDDYSNVFRWSSNVQKKEDEDPVIPDEPKPDCPDGQVRGVSGKCIEDKEYADNPWEEPKKIPKGLKDKRDDWDANWDPTRYVSDPSELGSIPYIAPSQAALDEDDYSSKAVEALMRSADFKGRYI
tara:strand:+ start:9307 stop:10092 length:786 start_codon:yes stop_codon:yes gene_type:complete